MLSSRVLFVFVVVAASCALVSARARAIRHRGLRSHFRAAATNSADDSVNTEGLFKLSQCNGLSPSARGFEIKQYICQNSKELDGEGLCVHQFREAKSPKGLVLLFHGYSACPQQFNALSLRLLKEGWDIFAPTMPGHGRPPCPDKPNCVKGYDVSQVPTNHKAYVDFAQQMTALATAFKKKNNVRLAIGGLSVGGAMATVAASIAGSEMDSLLTFAPFYGITAPPADRAWLKCREPAAKGRNKKDDTTKCTVGVIDKLVGGALTASSNNSASTIVASLLKEAVTEFVKSKRPEGNGPYNLMQAALRSVLGVAADVASPLYKEWFGDVPELFEQPFGWGAGCDAAVANKNPKEHRGGFCSFKIANLLGTHSIGQYAMDAAVTGTSNSKIRAHWSTVERDGLQRNSLILAAARKWQSTGVQATFSMNRMTCDNDADNTCGVPHSCLSWADNYSTKPNEMYWEDALLTAATNFLAKKPFTGTTQWNKNLPNARAVAQLFNIPQYQSGDPEGFLLDDIATPKEGSELAAKLLALLAKRKLEKEVQKAVKEYLLHLALSGMKEQGGKPTQQGTQVPKASPKSGSQTPAKSIEKQDPAVRALA